MLHLFLLNGVVAGLLGRVSQPVANQCSDIPAFSRRRVISLGTAAAAAMIVPKVKAEEKLIWISGKSDPIRKTSKDKTDGTKKDPK